jgi:GDP-L-fucose synthase
MTLDLAGAKVFVAGHRGMVGQALVRRLASEGCQVVSADRRELDLRRQDQVDAWMAANRPEVVFMAAARVGGIHANDIYPAEFIYDNLMISSNIVEAAHQTGVGKLVYLGSSCIYPRDAAQPMSEEALLTGPLEPSNQWYAVAKIAGVKLVQAYRRQYGCDFIAAQPTNLYGPFDNFDLQVSHVIPALIRKAHTAATSGAATMEVWGSGRPMREFLHVDDLADALVFLAKHYSDEEIVNVGSGDEVSIGQLATMIAEVAGFRGAVSFNASKPDGTPRKLVNSDKIHQLGWTAQTPLARGLRETYAWFAQESHARGVKA